MIVVAITGASGVIYGKRLIEVLKDLGKDTTVVVSDPAKIILEYELGIKEDEIEKVFLLGYRQKGIEISL